MPTIIKTYKYLFLIVLFLFLSVTAIASGIHILFFKTNAYDIQTTETNKNTDTKENAEIKSERESQIEPSQANEDKPRFTNDYLKFNQLVKLDSPLLKTTLFHEQEPEGRWTQKESYISFYAPKGSELHGLKMTMQAISLNLERKSTILYRTSLNGRWHIPSIKVEGQQTLVWSIPSRHIAKDYFVQIKISTPAAVSPKSLNINDDTRVLGMFVKNISFSPGS